MPPEDPAPIIAKLEQELQVAKEDKQRLGQSIPYLEERYLACYCCIFKWYSQSFLVNSFSSEVTVEVGRCWSAKHTH